MDSLLFLQTLSSSLSFFPNLGGSSQPQFIVSGAVIVCPRITLQVLPANAGPACQCSSDSSAVFQTFRPCEGVGRGRQSDRKQFQPSVFKEFPKDAGVKRPPNAETASLTATEV